MSETEETQPAREDSGAAQDSGYKLADPAQALDAQEDASEQGVADVPQSAPSEDESGLLVGTTSEQAPGVGDASHPAPAAMRDPQTGEVRVAGSPPSAASGTVPASDSPDEQAGDVTDPQAREQLSAVHELENEPTDRPDIGTPDEQE